MSQSKINMYQSKLKYNKVDATIVFHFPFQIDLDPVLQLENPLQKVFKLDGGLSYNIV